MPLRVDRIHPSEGWPGSLLTIDGEDFSTALDDNIVTIAGSPGLIVRCSPEQLLVLAPIPATSGPVEVSVAGSPTVAGPEDFRVREDWPDTRDARESGPPVIFAGPDVSTPQVRVKKQRTLVILAHGKGNPPPDALNQGYLQSLKMENAARFWREASYQKTTFDFVLTSNPLWIELPRPMWEYIWNPGDLEWARREYLRSTKRSAVVAGGLLFAIHQGLRLSRVGIADLNAPTEQSTVMNIGAPFHVAVSGTHAYIAAGSDGVFVVNLAAAGGPAVVRQLPSAGGRPIACDVLGTILAVAALEGGLHIYDISNPAAPTLSGTMATADWATTVRLAPGRAYLGVGSTVTVVDLMTPANPSFAGSAPAGAWVMGLDIAGALCAVATDGAGLVLFDISGWNPIERGSQMAVLRLHAVSLAGNIAYAAAGTQGLVVVDVSNPVAPVGLATHPTPRACYAATVSGTRVWLSLGGKIVQGVDVANPAAPVPGPELHLTGTFIFGADPKLDELRANLANADNQQGLKKSDALLLDAIEAARAAHGGNDPTKFQGIVVVAYDGRGRAESGLNHQLTANGRTLTLFDSSGASETKGLLWLPGDATWGRWAHELGHWFKMADNYVEQHDDGTFTRGDAQDWCLSGDCDLGSLFCAREADRMRLYETVNVQRRTWAPSAAPYHEEFDLVAHGQNEDAGNGCHLLELVLAVGSLAYYVEVRQFDPATLIFDQNLPNTANPSCVVVTRAFYETSDLNNAAQRPVKLFGVLRPGESVVDAARLLRVEVLAQTGDNPAAYRVKVTWNEEPLPDPAGRWDLMITPWNTTTWETPDIWINSTLNDSGGVARYEYSEPGDNTRPILNGDRPWVKRPNTVFARIRNAGPDPARDVYVSFSTTSPPGIGDNGTWVTQETRHVPVLAGNDSMELQFVWEPAADKHTCLQIAIMPQQGERQVRNGRAQENVAAFDSRGSSSHDPVIFDAEVRNPFSVGRRVELRVIDLPRGWHAVIQPSWVWLEPKGSAPVRAVIWTDLHSPRAHRGDRIDAEVFPRVEGWTTFDHEWFPIGGVLVPVRANSRGTFNWELMARGNTVVVNAFLAPKTADVPVTAEITHPNGSRSQLTADTDAGGMAQFEFELEDGNYAVQLFSASTPTVAETETEVRRIELPA
jgi:hypothetical protein